MAAKSAWICDRGPNVMDVGAAVPIGKKFGSGLIKPRNGLNWRGIRRDNTNSIQMLPGSFPGWVSVFADSLSRSFAGARLRVRPGCRIAS